jgi:hypothetical protein
VHVWEKPRTLDPHCNSPATTAPIFVAGDIKGEPRRGLGWRPDKPPASHPTGQGNNPSPAQHQQGARPAPEQRPPGTPPTRMPSSMGAPPTARQPCMTAPPAARPPCLPTLATPQAGGTARQRDPPPRGQRLGSRLTLIHGPSSLTTIFLCPKCKTHSIFGARSRAQVSPDGGPLHRHQHLPQPREPRGTTALRAVVPPRGSRQGPASNLSITSSTPSNPTAPCPLPHRATTTLPHSLS